MVQTTAVNALVTSYFSSSSQLQDYRRPEAFCIGELPELHPGGAEASVLRVFASIFFLSLVSRLFAISGICITRAC